MHGPAETIEAVIFDIGNVLVRWDIRALYAKLIADPEELDWFLRTVVTMEWHSQHDAGRPMDETIAELSAAYPAYAELIAAFKPRWTETILGPIEGSVALLQRLHTRGVPLYALTNYSAETFPLFRRDYPFAGWFRDIVVSGEHKLIKPDPRIFTLAIQRFEITPQRTLFIDDRPDNVTAGRSAGLLCHHFTGPDRLEAALRRHGLLD
ncbi:MAG: HAD family hydrolase [Rhodothalassiaceae bacterium]